MKKMYQNTLFLISNGLLVDLNNLEYLIFYENELNVRMKNGFNIDVKERYLEEKDFCPT